MYSKVSNGERRVFSYGHGARPIECLRFSSFVTQNKCPSNISFTDRQGPSSNLSMRVLRKTYAATRANTTARTSALPEIQGDSSNLKA